jgi:importin subunit beta-1
MLPLVDKEPITGLITKGRRGKASKSRTLATWATKEIRKLKAISWGQEVIFDEMIMGYL